MSVFARNQHTITFYQVIGYLYIEPSWKIKFEIYAHRHPFGIPICSKLLQYQVECLLSKGFLFISNSTAGFFEFWNMLLRSLCMVQTMFCIFVFIFLLIWKLQRILTKFNGIKRMSLRGWLNRIHVHLTFVAFLRR